MEADGFTLVTRRTRVGEDDDDEAGVVEGGGGGAGGYESTNAKRKRRRGDLAAPAFYAARERKGASLEALRAGFDADRARIEAIKGEKAKREFRP